MKKTTTGLVSLIVLSAAASISVYVSCARTSLKNARPPVHSSPAGAKMDATPADHWVVVTNGGNNHVEVYDPTVSDWNTAAALKHSYYPNGSNGFTDPTVGWNGAAEARLRQLGSNLYLLVVSGGGFCGVIPYPALSGKYWANNLGGAANMHCIELLPDGNVAVSGSDGNFVRVYTATQGTYSGTYAEFKLNAAHGILWDPGLSRLWVTGQDAVTGKHILTTLVVGGTLAAPTLTEDTTHRSILPTPWGHDVSCYYGDTDKLFVSTNGGAYVYDKTTRTFTGAPGGANQSFVKAIGNQPLSGQIIETFPNSACSNGWSTPVVSFYNPSGSRTITGACIYKARVFWYEYQ